MTLPYCYMLREGGLPSSRRGGLRAARPTSHKRLEQANRYQCTELPLTFSALAGIMYSENRGLRASNAVVTKEVIQKRKEVFRLLEKKGFLP